MPKNTTSRTQDAQASDREERPASLATFISTNIELILMEWEAFAKKISPNPKMDKRALRDHGADILHAIVLDMRTVQDAGRKIRKSRGDENGEGSHLIQTAAGIHASTRMESGFDVLQLVAEYRAMRASVLRLWHKTKPALGEIEFDQVGRFNESIDQSLAMALEHFTELVDRSRHLFLGILGHDLRNPVAAISMNAQILSGSGNLVSDMEALATNIRSSADAMHQIVDDLLDFARRQLGTSMPITTSATEMCGLCREVVDEIRAAFPKCSFDLSLPENEIDGHWDRARIRQMLSNLLGNACEHGEGLIELHVSVDGDDVQLLIRNEAEAIPPELLPNLFDPLVRGSSQPTGQGRKGSLGLGLYIVREIVHGHNGTIDVESSEEAGTAFTIHLPRHTKA